MVVPFCKSALTRIKANWATSGTKAPQGIQGRIRERNAAPGGGFLVARAGGRLIATNSPASGLRLWAVGYGLSFALVDALARVGFIGNRRCGRPEYPGWQTNIRV